MSPPKPLIRGFELDDNTINLVSVYESRRWRQQPHPVAAARLHLSCGRQASSKYLDIFTGPIEPG